MTITKQILPQLSTVKEQAKRLRSSLSGSDTPISHSKSLELIAHQLGFNDWNTLHAVIGNRPSTDTFKIGEAVNGRYLGQSFTGTILGVQSLQNASRFRLSLNLETPIDVVTFDSFSSFRQRINCTVDRQGISAERTSDGRPQMIMDLKA